MRSTVATVPNSAYSPWTRGTMRTSALAALVDRMPGKDAWLGALRDALRQVEQVRAEGPRS